MPELPEVETIRRDLASKVVGRTIAKAECTGLRCIRRHPDAVEFTARLDGRTISAVDRRGKYLLLRLEAQAPPADVLVVHLGMSGQLIWADSPDQPRPKHTHVVLRFDHPQPAELRYVDPRTFGELFVGTGAELAHLGPDPLGDVSPTRLAEMLKARRTKLKPLLLDQAFLAGIGNMYADEILFAARLRHDRPADSLTASEAKRLHRAMTTTLTAAIEHRGSSLADEQYRDLFGKVGDYQRRHRVYDREGQPCPRCDRPIVRRKWQGRSTFSCDHCQA